MTHVIHKPDPIPWSEARESLIEAGKLRRKFLKDIRVNANGEPDPNGSYEIPDPGNHAEEGVNMVTKKMDEDRIIHELSVKTYITALELMKRYHKEVKRMLKEHPDKIQQECLLGMTLRHAFKVASEIEDKPSETTNP